MSPYRKSPVLPHPSEPPDSPVPSKVCHFFSVFAICFPASWYSKGAARAHGFSFEHPVGEPAEWSHLPCFFFPPPPSPFRFKVLGWEPCLNLDSNPLLYTLRFFFPLPAFLQAPVFFFFVSIACPEVFLDLGPTVGPLLVVTPPVNSLVSFRPPFFPVT